MKVELIDKMGTDLSVVNAARVSYAKEKEEFEESDERLIRYLAEHKHTGRLSHIPFFLFASRRQCLWLDSWLNTKLV